MAKVTGSLQKSTEIMKLSNQLIRLPQISQTMREMSMEMTKVSSYSVVMAITFMILFKAGILEEMLDDTLNVEDDEELEEEADAEVDKVLFDLTNGKLGQAGTVQNPLPVSRSVIHMNRCLAHFINQAVEETVDDAETERVMEQYRQQLSGLLN